MFRGCRNWTDLDDPGNILTVKPTEVRICVNMIKLSTAGRIILGLLMSALGGVAFVLAFPPYEI
jgi:hypothetical protein